MHFSEKRGVIRKRLDVERNGRKQRDLGVSKLYHHSTTNIINHESRKFHTFTLHVVTEVSQQKINGRFKKICVITTTRLYTNDNQK